MLSKSSITSTLKACEVTRLSDLVQASRGLSNRPDDVEIHNRRVIRYQRSILLDCACPAYTQQIAIEGWNRRELALDVETARGTGTGAVVRCTAFSLGAGGDVAVEDGAAEDFGDSFGLVSLGLNGC